VLYDKLSNLGDKTSNMFPLLICEISGVYLNSYLRVKLRRCHWAPPEDPLLQKHHNSLRLLLQFRKRHWETPKFMQSFG